MSDKNIMPGWSVETLHRDYRQCLKVEKLLFEADTGQQKLRLFENQRFGRVLTLDDVVQTTEADEFIYHEMLTHLPVLAHGHVKDALIIGGGDGGMLEELLKHKSVRHATMVEIDAGVVDFSREYLPNISKGAFDDPRLDLVIADGAESVAATEHRYDLAIVDSTDPIGPGEALFTDSFYAGLARCLKPGGILVTQNGVPFMQPEELRQSLAILSGLFAEATCYLASVPSYAGGPMAFGWATNEPAHKATPLATLVERYQASGVETDYYRPEMHAGAFALPGYVARLLPTA